MFYFQDEFIAEYAGEIISETEFQRRSNESAAKRNDEEKHYIMVLREPKRYIDAKYYGNVARVSASKKNEFLENLSFLAKTIPLE